MELTRKQEEGLKIAVERFKNHEKYTIISGYAGVGKSTLVKFIIEALNVEPHQVVYTAFTGKAAEILRKKGNKNVCTLHKLLYTHYPLPGGGFRRLPKKVLEYKVVIVDEVSMVPKPLMELLFSHRAYIICLGDPFQLPPINKKEDNGLLAHPHIFLDEVMRQAAESEIIRLTMDIRNHKPINFNDSGKEVLIFPKEKLNTGMLLWADQILVGTNATRYSLNTQMRELLGFRGEPQEGEKVICLRNYWETLSYKEADPLVNGTIGYLKNGFKTFRSFPPSIPADKHSFDIWQANFSVGEDFYENTEIDYSMLISGKKCCDWRTEYSLMKKKKQFGEIVPKEFAYAYAITCHKAQGSEWDKVLVLEEKFPFEAEEHARWLYTACTRASEKLVLIR